MDDDYIKPIASETLSVFETITGKAKEELKKRSRDSNIASALVHGNTINSTGIEASIVQQDRRSTDIKNEYSSMVEQPAFARIVVSDADEQQHVFYVTRRGQVSINHEHESASLVSYKHPIGQLASLPVGLEKEITDNNGKTQYFEVLEKALYDPLMIEESWDSKPTVLSLGSETYTVKSLLDLFEEVGFDADDVLADIFKDHSDSTNILKGLRREIRTSAALRSKASLDQFQDEIFRLPLNNQLLIIGPPGTGKTTTLIKRLGQKLTAEGLSPAEISLVMPSETSIAQHQNSWLMFTPTDLLKHFVKEAFNQEQIPVSATNERIKTWDAYRYEISRQTLGILQTASAKSKFILKDQVSFVNVDIQRNPIVWYESFKLSHSERLLSQLHDGIAILETSIGTDTDSLIEQLKTITESSSTKRIQTVFEALYKLEGDIDKQTKKMKSESDAEIKKTINYTVNSEGRQFFEDMVVFLKSIKAADVDDDADSAFDNENEETSESSTGNITNQQALMIYQRTLRSLARYKYLKRSPSKNSATAKLSEWLGSRLPTDDKLIEIGRSIATQNGLRRFQKVFNRYVVDVPSSYKEFRKNALKDNTGQYSVNPKNNKHIDGTELDAIILLMLKNTRELLAQRFVINNLEKPGFGTLNIISQEFKNQILVDEATDFSALQLAVMESLTSLQTKSFFACGDFNQRISDWGLRSKEQIEWVSRSIVTKSIKTVYRQSRVLNLFAGELLKQFDGDFESRGELPPDMVNDGFPPALLENAVELDDVAIWLIARLDEVEIIADQMPTVAILVNTEEDVKPMTAALNEAAEETNLRAVACSDGQSLGEGSDIRVFDVKYIKGLEFEAVFFVGVDVLETQMPELFGKYLYVGATRAAMYFGISCVSQLPGTLEPLRESFIESWRLTND